MFATPRTITNLKITYVLMSLVDELWYDFIYLKNVGHFSVYPSGWQYGQYPIYDIFGSIQSVIQDANGNS